MDTSGPSPYWTTWTTDSIGKTSQRVDRNPSGTSTTAYTYPVNGSAQPHTITSAVTTGAGATTRGYGYDTAGNTTSRPSPTGVAQTLTYNDEGQLSHIDAGGAGVFDAIYDAFGTRILKREAGKTTLTVAGTDLTVDNTSGTLTASRSYTWQGLTVGVRTGNTNDLLWSIVTDHQGTAHNQIRNSDSQLQTSWQDPYGNQRGTAPTSWAGLKGFVGGTKDATGLVRVGARDYDPQLNRFTTVDPLLNLADPIQANPYGYADNSPATNSDPSGLMLPTEPDSGCPSLHTLSFHANNCGNGGSTDTGSDKDGKKKHHSGVVHDQPPAHTPHHPAQPHPKAPPAPPPTPVPVPVRPNPLPTKAPNGTDFGQWVVDSTTEDPGGGAGPAEAAYPVYGEGEAPAGEGEAPIPGITVPESIGEEITLTQGQPTNAIDPVPDPMPVFKSGAPDRSSAVYVSVQRADGTIETVGSRPGGIHAEDVAQGLEPGGQMSRPFGWRRDPNSGFLSWRPINVCRQCQARYSPALFPADTGADTGGAWGR